MLTTGLMVLTFFRQTPSSRIAVLCRQMYFRCIANRFNLSEKWFKFSDELKNIIDSQLDFVFTDGHANNYLSTQYGPENIDEVEKLVDFEATRQKYWKNEDDLDLKRRKEAEFLVKGDIPYNAVLGFIVYNQTAKNELLKLGIKDENVHIIPEYYF